MSKKRRSSSRRRKTIPKPWMYGGVAFLALLTIVTVGLLVVPPSPDTDDQAANYGQLLATQKSEVSAKALAAAESRPALVAFMGDSYTAGAGATQNRGFATLVSTDLGVVEKNFARGGTGYIKRIDTGGIGACGQDVCPHYFEVADAVIKASPDAVIVSGGRNDPSDSVAFADDTKALFDKLRAGLPDAQIIATSPIWGASEPPAHAGMMSDAVRVSVEAVGGTFVDLGAPLLGHPELITADNVHPNDAGHQVLFEALKAGMPAIRSS